MKKRPLLAIFLVVFFDLLSFGIVIPILPYYSKSFGVGAFALGLLMASYSVMQFLFSPFWGSVSDRIGRRPVLLATIFAGASAMVATGLAKEFWILLLARAFAGIFAANISTASAYIADITSEENRAKGMGVIGAGFGLGFIFGPALGGILSGRGYTFPILLAAGLGFANFILAFFVLKEPEKHEKPESRSRWAGVNEALSHSRTKLPISLFFLHTLAFTQLEVAFGLFVLARFGLEARDAGKLLAFMGLVSAMLQGGLIGRLTKRFGEQNLVPAALALMVIAMFAAAFAYNQMIFTICLFGIALGMGITNPCLSSLTSKGAAPGRKGSILGVYQSAGSLARVLGPPVAGVLFDRLGPASPLLTASGLAAMATVLSFVGRKSLS